jgi:DNA-directed RNA polymerase specialized sigma24 family protein
MIDQVRARNRRPMDPTDDAVLAARLPSVEWESEALDRLATLELMELFECATSAQAEVLVLRFVGALTIPEIAQVLGKPVGAVKALQRRGLAAVADAIREGVYPLQPSWTLTAM